MKNIKKHLPIIIYTIYVLAIIIGAWTINDECGLGLLIPFLIAFLLIFIISIYYGVKTKSKRKYFLPIFFYLSIYLLNFLCFTLKAIIYNPEYKISNIFSLDVIEELILNFFLFTGLSLSGIIIGSLIRKAKKTKIK